MVSVMKISDTSSSLEVVNVVVETEAKRDSSAKHPFALLVVVSNEAEADLFFFFLALLSLT